MKILVFTDTHGSEDAFKKLKAKIKKENPDLLVCLGDFTVFGHDQKKILKKFNALNKTILLIHGNHEHAEEVREDVEDLDNIIFVHEELYRYDDVLFVAYGGGGFSRTEPGFKRVLKKFKAEAKENDRIILLTHAPPYGALINIIDSEDCGCRTFSRFIKKYKPIYAFAGHLHENSDSGDVLDSTEVINPGPYGRIIVIDN